MSFKHNGQHGLGETHSENGYSMIKENYKDGVLIK